MGIFSKLKEEKELVLVFDIGSSSIGGALFETKKGGIPKIILSTREPIAFEEKIDVDRFLKLTLKSLENVANRISGSGFKPSKIFCVLSSPWCASQTRVIKLEKNAPFVFTSKLADSLIQKEIGLFEEENAAKFNDPENKVRLIEFKSMKTILNSYVTPDPFNKKAKKLEMVVYITIGGEQTLKRMEESISKYIYTENIKFASFGMSSFVVARDLFVYQDNFLLTDISGEMTDISIVKKDVLSNSISYPLGWNFIVRGVAEYLNCSLSEARSFISLYKDGHATESVEQKLEPIIKILKKQWLDKFQESLMNLSDDISVPATIFITVDLELADFFSKLIKNEQFNQYTLTESEFRLIFLNTEILKNAAFFEGDALKDPFVIIESIYLNRIIC